ncbi:hypothetical protein PR048_001541 [Dryococelus australis]|uniref:CCHC-type domain-containing protein n=1 Tax=Dryococelus australis TaxID=614101 RepID=A0ABQ9IK37_9NEOP|nr:hypothetical protein PR048_001541 [Dryococelus australis]
MKDKKISEQLQLQPALSLEEAVLIATQAEIQSQQLRLLQQGGSEYLELNRACWGPSHSRDKGPHDSSRCPARSAKCFRCDKPGHWAVVCKASGASMVFTVQEEQGADITCIPGSMGPVSYRDFVVSCKVRVKGPDDKDLRVLGFLQLQLEYGSAAQNNKVFVLSNLQTPLLGRAGLIRLKIVGFQGEKVMLPDTGTETIQVVFIQELEAKVSEEVSTQRIVNITSTPKSQVEMQKEFPALFK